MHESNIQATWIRGFRVNKNPSNLANLFPNYWSIKIAMIIVCIVNAKNKVARKNERKRKEGNGWEGLEGRNWNTDEEGRGEANTKNCEMRWSQVKVLNKIEKNYPTMAKGGCQEKHVHTSTGRGPIWRNGVGVDWGDNLPSRIRVDDCLPNSWCEYKVNKNKNIKSKFRICK